VIGDDDADGGGHGKSPPGFLVHSCQFIVHSSQIL
jgi:hypothetical protein